MVLKPLEYSDALADSPWFRQNLNEHEKVLRDTSENIQKVEQQCRKLITCAKKLSQAQRAFASSLCDFKFESVGTNQTDDERAIASCLSEFGKLLNQIEDRRAKIIDQAERVYVDPLKNLADRIEKKLLHDERKKFEKESSKFYSNLEKHLHLSTVRKSDFREADNQLALQQRDFCRASLQYVAEIQAVQERMKFEFVETLSSFLSNWLSVYHTGYVAYENFQPKIKSINNKVQHAKESFETTQVEANSLKQRMLMAHIKNVFPSSSGSNSSDDQPLRSANSNIKQGYVYMQEKSKIPKTIGRDVLSRNWTKYYCVYSKETRIFTMIPVNTSSKTDMRASLEQSVSFKLKTCIRRASDSIDKRFCFDLVGEDRSEIMTFQALSDEDRRQWLDAMDGKEPVYSPGAGPPSSNSFDTMLDETGFEFVRQCLKAIEEKGIKEQGLYRNCGVTSKVQRLMQIALDKRKSVMEKLNLSDDSEWETKTISSAVKTFLRNLPEPLMTFDLHSHFINAAKMDDAHQRVSHIHYYVYKLPEAHRRMLEMIIRHLRLVADNSTENLMTVGNLGVCFGPTLLRPKEETMAAIMDIKFFNVVVEVLIANCHQIFNTPPPQQIGMPCPPKPLHNMVPVMSPANNTNDYPQQPSSARNASSTDLLNNKIYDSPPEPTPGTPSSQNTPPNRPRTILTTQQNPTPGLTPVRHRQPPPPPLQKIHNSNSTSGGSQGLVHDSRGYDSHSNDDLSSASSLCPSYGNASTSAGQTPSLSQQPVLTGNGANSLRRQGPRVIGDGSPRTVDNSSDSLNSLGSDRSPTSLNPTLSSTSLSSHKSKVTASYAPPYNPYASENLHHAIGAQVIGNTGLENSENNSSHNNQNSTTGRLNLASLQPLHSVRIPPMYTSLINPNVQCQPSRRVKTLYACVAGHDTELSFEPGQIITNVYESKEEGWFVGTLNGKTGLIPANYVEPLPGPYT
uniref:Rho GTPase-activating protein 26 n=1 Tax=Acrobeloides nanus TaxID=290746 RepID=A0A914E7L2_9BILA